MLIQWRFPKLKHLRVWLGEKSNKSTGILMFSFQIEVRDKKVNELSRISELTMVKHQTERKSIN